MRVMSQQTSEECLGFVCRLLRAAGGHMTVTQLANAIQDIDSQYTLRKARQDLDLVVHRGLGYWEPITNSFRVVLHESDDQGES